MKRLASLAIALALACASAAAHDYTLGHLHIEHPYAYPTPPGARTGGAYFAVQNTGNDNDRLLRIASPAADAVELHSMTMDGNLMKMRTVGAIGIPAGSKVTLGSGGYHVMLVGLKRQLAIGDKVPLALTFEKAGTVDVTAYVEKQDVSGETAHRH